MEARGAVWGTLCDAYHISCLLLTALSQRRRSEGQGPSKEKLGGDARVCVCLCVYVRAFVCICVCVCVSELKTCRIQTR